MNEEFDPYQDYEIRTLNPDYSGTAYGVDFQKGYARLYGLSRTATPDEVRERIHNLLEMRNAGENTRRVEDANGVKVEKGLTYRIEQFDPHTPRRAKVAADA